MFQPGYHNSWKFGIVWGRSHDRRGADLEEGDRELLSRLSKVCLHDTAAQAVVPHQPPATVLAQVEVLQPNQKQSEEA